MSRPREIHKDLPRFVSRFNDRHGIVRHRFRRTGARPYYFVAYPGTPDFDAEYELCLAGSEPPKPLPSPKSAMRHLQETLGALRPQDGGNFVYIVGEESGPLKIGFANDPVTRLCELQIGNPRLLWPYALRNGGRRTERDLHKRLKMHRQFGEWFDRDAVLHELETRGFWLTLDISTLATHLPNDYKDRVYGAKWCARQGSHDLVLSIPSFGELTAIHSKEYGLTRRDLATSNARIGGGAV